MNNNKEQWKVVENHQNYVVSNRGKLKRLDDVPVRIYPNPHTGYLQVSVKSDSGEWETQLVHRLVAQAFIPNPNNLEQVDHIDGNRTRNCVSNLRWVSRQFNNSRPRAKRLRAQANKGVSHIHQFVKATKGSEVMYAKNASQMSRKIGCSHVLAIKALRGDCNTAKGWKLQYLLRSDEEFKTSGVDVSTKVDRMREYRKIIKTKRQNALQNMELELAMKYRTDLASLRDEFARNRHAIVQYTLDGEFVREWKSASAASQKLSIKGIHAALRKENGVAGGFVWKYKYI